MPELLALDREPHRICGVLADVGSGSVRVRNTFAFDIPEQLQDSPELGSWLRDELKNARISAKQAIVCVPREDVVVRHLDLPPVPDDELPQIVRFQAAAKSTVSLDQLALDYLPLPAREGLPGREVLVSTVDQKRIRRLKSLGSDAGVEVQAVGVSSVSAAALVSAAEQQIAHQPGDVSIIICRHGDRVEISLAGERHLYSTHSTQVTPGDSQQSTNAILAEISRSIVALQKRLSDMRVMRCWLIGSKGEDESVGDAVRQRFNCDVRELDPFSGRGIELACEAPTKARGAFAGPVGLLLARETAGAEVIDFLSPRRPAEKVDYTKQKRIGVVAVAALLFVGVFAYRSVVLSGLEEELTSKEQTLEEKKANNKQLAPKVADAGDVDEWYAKRVDWLHEADDLAETIDGTERLYLTSLNFGEGLRGERGAITGGGQARQRFDVEALNAELVSRENTEINAKPINSNGRDSEYPENFQLDVRLKEQQDTQPTK